MHRGPSSSSPVEFGYHRETPDIRDGITHFGSFEDNPREIEIIPVVVESQRRQMEQTYRPIEVWEVQISRRWRTFASRLTYQGIIAAADPNGVVGECKH